MAKIWFARDGKDPTRGGPIAELPLATITNKLALTHSDYLCDLSTTPRFGDPSAETSMIFGYKHVVVQIDKAEAVTHGWKSGFYRASCSPQEAFEILGLRAT